MGLDAYLYDNGEGLDEIPSDQHPDHLCNKTYLRSSYNEAGFNHVARDLTGKELWWVFAPVLGSDNEDGRGDLPEGAYEGTPVNVTNWLLARGRACILLDMLKACDNLRICSWSPTNKFKDPKMEEVSSGQAMTIYREHVESHADGSHSYSNTKGLFLAPDDALTIHAIINGKDVLGEPCVHIVYTADIEWYVQMAEVVIEFIDHALTLDAPGIVWSH